MAASGFGAVDRVAKAGDSMIGTLVLSGSTPLQVTTTTPGTGKVLVSDASGNVSWGTVSTSGVAAPLALSSGQAASSILSVTNTTAAPSIEAVIVTSQAPGDRAVGVQVTGDTNKRHSVDSNGAHTWGPGNAVTDTNLYRSAVNTLKTDNSLVVAGAATVTGALAANGGTSTSSIRVGTSATLGQVLTTDTLGNGSWASPYAGTWGPTDHGLIAWNYDPTVVANSQGTTGLTAGTIYLAGMQVRSAVTLSALWIAVATAGNAATCYLGLYDSGGTRRGVSASFTAAATGPLSQSITPYSAAPGLYWVAFLIASSTANPALAATNIGFLFEKFANVNLGVAVTRFGTNSTGQATLPASITPASNVQPASGNGMEYWCAVS